METWDEFSQRLISYVVEFEGFARDAGSPELQTFDHRLQSLWQYIDLIETCQRPFGEDDDSGR